MSGISSKGTTTRFSSAWNVVMSDPSAANMNEVCGSSRTLASSSESLGTWQAAAKMASTTMPATSEPRRPFTVGR